MLVMLKLFGRVDGLVAKALALGMVCSNIMMTDQDLVITYVNPAMVKFLQGAKADFRHVLPGFDATQIVGSKIDMLGNDAAGRRALRESLQTSGEITIQIGMRSFDLIATAIIDKGKRTGFVVEWSDACGRLLDTDRSAQIAAINRSQAIVEFAMDGTIQHANENFLKLIGYRLDELRGRHHSMLVAQDQASSRDYVSFWNALRKGEYQAGQFRRVGKHGKEILIEGSYNPIFDAQGRVSKIIKFAYDVSSQMLLVAELKVLIDGNFQEIDSAMSHSASEARLASRAADETADNVRSVAASAEQLATSVAEIAQSMEKSRRATEDAFTQTEAVGKSTETLSAAAQAMNGIVGLIRNVASQINLLALNATIEAARAGDAGRGFAVVASEVKNLAIQAAGATDQIASQIKGIQTTSSNVSNALAAIRDSVMVVREHVTVTASAVEEQGAVTRSLSTTMQQAAQAVSTVSTSVTEISASMLQAATAVAKAREAATGMVR
ncbi:MAG: methyl-accepting chemotaxis protein [Janthinobacterium lividum]